MKWSVSSVSFWYDRYGVTIIKLECPQTTHLSATKKL